MSEYHNLCSTKAKRLALVEVLRNLSREVGAQFSLNVMADGALIVVLTKGAYMVDVEFDGRSKVGAFLGHWCTDRSGARYPDGFDIAIGGSVNPHHRAKATTCEDTFEGLKASFRRGMETLT